ncbi:MAG: hypothetical protein KAG18_03430, partial [Sinobacterium sp.]|nr:hypothetical protein [Sinobacterium sp.]
DSLPPEHAIICLESLIKVLDQRRHTRVVMGKEIIVGGTLSKALKLPELLKQTRSIQSAKREQALERFVDIWPTFSAKTRQLSLAKCDWYNPEDDEDDEPSSFDKDYYSDDD